MQIFVNGSERQIPDHSSLSNLIELLDLGNQRFAIEVNEELIPRSSFQQQHFAPGDRIEVVQAIGGG